jgi:hypothetical protein
MSFHLPVLQGCRLNATWCRSPKKGRSDVMEAFGPGVVVNIRRNSSLVSSPPLFQIHFGFAILSPSIPRNVGIRLTQSIAHKNKFLRMLSCKTRPTVAAESQCRTGYCPVALIRIKKAGLIDLSVSVLRRLGNAGKIETVLAGHEPASCGVVLAAVRCESL